MENSSNPNHHMLTYIQTQPWRNGKLLLKRGNIPKVDGITKNLGLNINLLELKAIYFALLALCKTYKNIHICIRSDSSTAVTYRNRRGGSILPLSNEAKNIWVGCFNRNMYLSAVHILGKENVNPDYLSWEYNDYSESMLTRDIFDKISKIVFIPKKRRYFRIKSKHTNKK